MRNLNQIDCLILDINQRLLNLEYLINKPRLFISEYFYSLRNEIDLQAEELLLNLNNSLNEEENCTNEDYVSEDIFNYDENCIDVIEFPFFEKEKLNEINLNKSRNMLINKLKVKFNQINQDSFVLKENQ